MRRQHAILARTAVAPGGEFEAVRLLPWVGVTSERKCVASAAGRQRKGQERSGGLHYRSTALLTHRGMPVGSEYCSVDGSSTVWPKSVAWVRLAKRTSEVPA